MCRLDANGLITHYLTNTAALSMAAIEMNSKQSRHSLSSDPPACVHASPEPEESVAPGNEAGLSHLIENSCRIKCCMLSAQTKDHIVSCLGVCTRIRSSSNAAVR